MKHALIQNHQFRNESLSTGGYNRTFSAVLRFQMRHLPRSTTPWFATIFCGFWRCVLRHLPPSPYSRKHDAEIHDEGGSPPGFRCLVLRHPPHSPYSCLIFRPLYEVRQRDGAAVVTFIPSLYRSDSLTLLFDILDVGKHCFLCKK